MADDLFDVGERPGGGYLPLSRKIFKHKFWNEEREFTRFEAWLDLLQMANYEDKTKILNTKNGPVEYKRGQVPASVRFLQERWKWGSTTKVTNFLSVLELDGSIDLGHEKPTENEDSKKDSKKTAKKTGHTVITICNYDTYNVSTKKERQQKSRNKDSKKDQSNNTTTNVVVEKNKEDIYNELVLEQFELLDAAQQDRWNKYLAWYQSQDFKVVTEIENQITPAQLFKLLENYSADKIKLKIQEIENNGNKRYKSVYLTVDNWLKRDKK